MNEPLLSIIEPHPVTVIGIKQIAESAGFKNIMVHSKVDDFVTYQKMLDVAPSIIIMELLYPNNKRNPYSTNPIDLLLRVKKSISSTKILVFTYFDDPQIITQTIQLGIDAYVLKYQDDTDLLNAIVKVNEGKKYFSNEIAEVLATIILHGTYKVTEDSNSDQLLARLTDREKEVVLMIGKGFKNEEIAEKLFVDPRTISTHKQNIKKKLELNDSNALVRYILENLSIIRGFF